MPSCKDQGDDDEKADVRSKALSDGAQRVQSLLQSLEQKKDDVSRATSDINRSRIVLEGAARALNGIRQQLLAELTKLDPEGFEGLVGAMARG